MSVTSRQRSVPPTMFDDERLMELPSDVRLTGLGLRFYVDDEGRGSARPALIKGRLWPLEPEVDEASIEDHLLRLDEAGEIQLYTAEGRSLLAMVDWPRVDRGRTSTFPPPPAREALATSSRHPREDLAVVEREGERGSRERGEGEGEAGEREAPPSRLPTDEPSPFCTKHPDGTDHPCGPCGTARKRLERWQRAQADTEAARIDVEMEA